MNLRNDAVPAETFNRANVEYCWRARARCTAAVSNADTLLKPPVITHIWIEIFSVKHIKTKIDPKAEL